ncbi:hypothetical protein Pfo_017372 [Paulownia fortunei]|nr:hypothetical protein Pfo_017372 [Paulownia fortunei]
MSSSSSDESAHVNCNTTVATSRNNYNGIRRRKWGKWVSEIRVPGTPNRLWLGSYITPEAAAVAHDVAFYCLRGDSSLQNLNFPLILPATARIGLSPRSVQKAASDAGLAIDARLLDSQKAKKLEEDGKNDWLPNNNEQEYMSISVEDYL